MHKDMEELLKNQMKALAEASKHPLCTREQMAALTEQMCNIFAILMKYTWTPGPLEG